MTTQELRELRREHGLSQAGLAAKLGYHANYIYRLESGKIPITQKFEKLVHAVLREEEVKKIFSTP